MATETEEVTGVLNNKWPCCLRSTQFHNIKQYGDGDERTVECSKDGRRWLIKFTITTVCVMKLLKLNWEEIGARNE